jgi:hypothetical protein
MVHFQNFIIRVPQNLTMDACHKIVSTRSDEFDVSVFGQVSDCTLSFCADMYVDLYIFIAARQVPSELEGRENHRWVREYC